MTRMPNLKANLCNCLVGGHKVTKWPDGSWTRNRIEWQLEGYNVSLCQIRDVSAGPINAFIDGCTYTTDVIIHDVQRKHRDYAKEIVFDLSILLSFICESRIWPYRLEYPEGSGQYATNSTVGTARHFRPVVNIRDGKSVYNFINTVWQGYRKIGKKRKLKEVFHYLYLTEHPENPIELKLIIAFTILENMKNTWAHSQGIPFAFGFYRKISSPPKTNIKKEKAYGFEEMLQLMLEEMRMKRGLKRIVKRRNELIHSGLSGRPGQSLFKTYEACHDIIREYILRLIGFSGDFFPYSTPRATKSI